MKETQERCSQIWLKQGQQGESRRSTKAGKAVRLAAKVAMKELEKVVGKPRPASIEECILRTNSTGVWSWVWGTVRRAERSPRSSWLVGRENLLSVDLQNPGHGEWDAWPRTSNYAQHIKYTCSISLSTWVLLALCCILPPTPLFIPSQVCMLTVSHWGAEMLVLVTQEI